MSVGQFLMERAKFKTIAKALLLTAFGAALLALATLALGLYNVAANRQHLQPVFSLLEFAVHRSVRRHASDVQVPVLDDPVLLQRGATCFRDKCLQCHGGPGMAQGDLGQGMQPLPGPLIDASKRWNAGELYWITRNGLKMTGMPAWEHHLSEDDLWAVVGFMHKLPQLSPREFAEWMLLDEREKTRCEPPMPKPLLPADAERGRRALYAYACVGCHAIPGTVQSNPQVGPPLSGMARRTRIAGVLDNTPQNMEYWLRETQSIKPGTAMPSMGVGEQDARDMAAYLQTLH